MVYIFKTGSGRARTHTRETQSAGISLKICSKTALLLHFQCDVHLKPLAEENKPEARNAVKRDSAK
jgi:hypothetical protein